MKRWNVLRQIVGIALAILILVGCAPSLPTNKPLTPTPVILTPTPTPIPTPMLTPTPQSGSIGTPVPGQWQANGNELGPFEFTVSPDSTTITDIRFHIINLMCGSVNVGAAEATASGPWPVSNGQFTLDTTPNLILDAIITGTFDKTGRHATGTWKGVVFGQTCLGTWTGNSTS